MLRVFCPVLLKKKMRKYFICNNDEQRIIFYFNLSLDTKSDVKLNH